MFRARIGLHRDLPAHPTAPPLSASCSSGQRFAFSFLPIPSRDGHRCRSANTSPCRVCRGLSPPSECALPGAQSQRPPFWWPFSVSLRRSQAAANTASVMTVKQAGESARQWMDEEASRIPEFRGAYTAGSTNWLADDAEMSPASDLDIMVVLAGQGRRAQQIRLSRYPSRSLVSTERSVSVR